MADVKDLKLLQSNCAEDYVGTPIVCYDILSELEDTGSLLQKVPAVINKVRVFCVDRLNTENTYISITGAIVCVECLHVIKKK
jgi:hypothetical protein